MQNADVKYASAEVISPLQLAFFGHAYPPEQALDKRSHPVFNFTC